MPYSASFAKIAFGILLAAALSACSAIYRNHGYAPSDEDLAGIVVGVDTRDSVAVSVGQPATAGLLTSSGWYYVQSRWKHYGLNKPQELEREVVAISFKENGVVANIERFGLEKGRIITLSRRVTDSSVQGTSFLRQLFGNLGKIDLSDAF